jgi:hypothetical protein
LKFLLDPSPNPIRSTSRVAVDKDSRLLPTSSSPKTLTTDLPKSILNNTNERESSSNVTDPIYSNIQVVQRPKKKVIPIEDEGDLIENDLLNLVEEEQQRDTPPALPMKNRSATIAGMTATHDSNTNALDVIIESSTKLVHPGKECLFGFFLNQLNVFLFRQRSSSSCECSTTNKTIRKWCFK